MAKLKTMTTQFIDGEPDGIRVCRCLLSTVTAVFVPRSQLARAKQISELPQRGIYYLISDQDGAISSIYIGQTRQGLTRLDDHNAKKDFWNKAVLFLADDSEFSLDTISALEKYAIDQAKAAKRYDVENKQDPKYSIDQFQQPIIEEIYGHIAFLMGTFGYQIENANEAIEDAKMFFTSRRGIRARGVYTGNSFDVLEGSPVDLNVEPHNDTYKERRNALIDSGDLAIDDNGMGYLEVTISFASPSGAADFVLGGSNNGWIEWKDDNKQTLDALYRA